MAKIEIYTTNTCPYCVRVKALLDNKNIAYEEINVAGDDEARLALVEKAEGRKSVPQVFIDGKPYGGFDDINALNQEGKLDEILNG